MEVGGTHAHIEKYRQSITFIFVDNDNIFAIFQSTVSDLLIAIQWGWSQNLLGQAVVF